MTGLALIDWSPFQSASVAGGVGGGAIKLGGIRPPNRIVSNILNAGSCCALVRSFPQRQSALWPSKRI